MNDKKIIKNRYILHNEGQFLLQFLFYLLCFIISLPIRIILIIIFLFINKHKLEEVILKIKNDFHKLLSFPLRWLFAAKSTILMILIFFIIFLFQNLVTPKEWLFYSFYPSDLINIHRIFTIFTSIFLHANISHLLLNSFAFYIFGRKIEKHYGYKMIFIFLFGGIFSNLVSGLISLYLLNNNIPGVGASGGIATLIMLAIILEPFSLNFSMGIPLPYFLIGWSYIFYDLYSRNLKDGIDHYTHLSGYFSVLILTLLLKNENKRRIIKGLLLNLAMLILFLSFNLFKKLNLKFLFQ